MDRASDFGSEGWGFESLRARYIFCDQFHHPDINALIGRAFEFEFLLPPPEVVPLFASKYQNVEAKLSRDDLYTPDNVYPLGSTLN